ncbi:MAG: hypothetical protein NTU53_13450 [Planctomycetota bacterium]|nr:hypothetical protein [Planctomycetota bacterium]
MGDAAQGEPIQHEVFTTPFKVEPHYEMWKTPNNYLMEPGGWRLPDRTKVWRVQNTGKEFGGVVSPKDAFDRFPDAEVLTVGFNVGKSNGSVGVGRHGNFFQWGFSGSPAQMTDAGRAFFLNCICYIRKFDGKPPLVKREHLGRSYVPNLAAFTRFPADPKWPEQFFPADALAKYGKDADDLIAYYRDNTEWIYLDRLFYVDEELKSAGIASNRTVAALSAMVEMMKDPRKSELAGKFLGRYTTESFKTREEWGDWLAANRGRIYFTDCGGYKFRVVPDGYLPPAR